MKKYLYKKKLLLFFTVTCRIIGALMQVFLALLAERIVDTAIKKDLNNFLKIIIFTIFYLLISGIFDYLTNTTQAIYLKSTLKILKEDIFNSIIRKEYKEFFKDNTANYISKLSNDINIVENNYIVPSLMLIGDIVIFASTIIILIFFNPFMTIIMILISVLLLIVPVIFGKAIDVRQKNFSDYSMIFTNNIKQNFEGYEVIKAYNIEQAITEEFAKVNTELENSRFKSTHMKAIAQTASIITACGSQLTGISIAAFLVLTGKLSAGQLLAVVQLSNGIQGPIMWIIQKMSLIKGSKSVNETLMSFIHEKERDVKEKKIYGFYDTIKMKNVSFSYDHNVNVINNFSFDFKKGKRYAIVGESGSGKSTLAKLLLGYYENYEGVIEVDDINQKMIDKSYNQLFSVIHQDIFLFNKTIKENITLYKEFPDDKIMDALEKSGLKKFVFDLPQGIDSLIAENGKNLSGGQKQRIAIARAFLHESPIIILDEATSSLDMETANDIENKLLNTKNQLIITITHKLSENILRKYDEIIVINKGNIHERGTFDELICANGEFKKLFSIDKLGE